jgi:hypothetical protein
MFISKTTKIGKTRRTNIGAFLATLLCTLVIVSTIGNSFGIRNSFVQAQLLAPDGSSWNNNMPTANNTTQHNIADPTTQLSSQTFTNSKNLDLTHSFVSNKVVGPDRFRFINYYWTTGNTPRGIDVGTSANDTFASASSLPPNQKLEVDTNEGSSTLAVVLQYEGVVNLAGITAALKLPSGFKANLPLIDNPNRFDIALSSYRGHIYPSQGIVLYFSVNVLPTAKVGVPVLGPLALHFLRTDKRSILDSLDASQQDIFASTLSIK